MASLQNKQVAQSQKKKIVNAKITNEGGGKYEAKGSQERRVLRSAETVLEVCHQDGIDVEVDNTRVRRPDQ